MPEEVVDGFEEFFRGTKVESRFLKKGREEGREEGEIKGRKEGEIKGKSEIAIEMLKDGLPIEMVAKYSKMPVEWVENLKNN